MPNRYTGTENDPFQEAQRTYLGKNWDRFLGAISGSKVRMSAPGGQIGASPSLGAMGTLDRIGDDDVQRSIAINAYLGNLQDSRRVNEQSLREMTNQNDAADAQARDRQTVERAVAIANSPNVSAQGRPIIGDHGDYRTAPPEGGPVDRQQIAAQMAPGLIPPPAPPKPVTFADPKPMMVNGKRVPVRAGSDGQFYGMDRKPIAPDTLELPPEKDATGGLDPDAVDYTATQYRILGPSGIPTRIEGPDRVKILNSAAKQASALGQSPAQAVQKQAAFKADAGSLNKMSTLKSSAESFETKAIAQADLVKSLSDKVGRTSIPLINDAILKGKKELAGDEDAQLYANALSTFGEEYAKIMTGTTGGSAAATDSARKVAHDLIRTGLTQGQIDKTIDQMKWEMRQTLKGYDATIGHITERMGGAAPTAPSDTTGTGGKKVTRYDMDGNPIK